MGATFTAEEIMELTEARIALGMMHEEDGRICTDTRELEEGDWFLALRGEEYDGHDFLGEAFSAGAIGCIVEERTSYPIASTSFPLLAVQHTDDALKKLARNWRKRINPRVALVPNDDALEIIFSKLRKECERRFAERFVTLDSVETTEMLAQLLLMPAETKVVLGRYQLEHFEEVEFLGDAALPNVVLMTGESIRRFRIQLSDSDMAGLSFSIMPTLKLHHGLLLVDSNFYDQLLAKVDPDFLDNVVVFGSALTDSEMARLSALKNDAPVPFVRPAGPPERLIAMIRSASEFAANAAPSSDQTDIYELVGMILQMLGIEHL
ncbi:MAG TPA: Mur ligase domain-containing protein [Oculatellaceae cyanobacterium]